MAHETLWSEIWNTDCRHQATIDGDYFWQRTQIDSATPAYLISNEDRL